MIASSNLGGLLLALVGNFGLAPADALTVGPSVIGHRHRRSRLGGVDIHQRHGYQSSSSSMRSSVINEIDSFYESFPYASAFITCGIKASAADIVAQRNEVTQEDSVEVFAPIPTAEEEKLQIDARRNLSFILYGGMYQGVAQFVIYNQIFPLIFGEGTDVATVLSKVAFDNVFISPLLCLPVAYLVKSVVFQFSLEEAKDRYFQDVKEGLIFKYWAFWMPAQCLTFSVIPVHLRIVFVAAVSFFWLVVFSSISSSTPADDTINGEC